MVLRRAAELSARRRNRETEKGSVSPEVLVQVAAAAGIPERDVRQALHDIRAEMATEPYTFARKFFGPARLNAVREVELPAHITRDYLEYLLRREQGLKLRRKTEASSLWDPGDLLGVVRRALDLSGHRILLKAHYVELRIEEIEPERCGAKLTADLSNQRGEYLSLGGVLGVTVSVLFVIAGVQNALYLLGAVPALLLPGAGFSLAYKKACADMRRALDRLLDAAEEGPPREKPPEERREAPGRIQNLRPIPRFSPQRGDGDE